MVALVIVALAIAAHRYDRGEDVTGSGGGGGGGFNPFQVRVRPLVQKDESELPLGYSLSTLMAVDRG